MEQSLEEIVDEGLYLIMLDERPALVAAIAELVALGQAPAAIEDHMRQCYGDTQMVRNVRHIAEHLTRLR